MARNNSDGEQQHDSENKKRFDVKIKVSSTNLSFYEMMLAAIPADVDGVDDEKEETTAVSFESASAFVPLGMMRLVGLTAGHLATLGYLERRLHVQIYPWGGSKEGADNNEDSNRKNGDVNHIKDVKTKGSDYHSTTSPPTAEDGNFCSSPLLTDDDIFVAYVSPVTAANLGIFNWNEDSKDNDNIYMSPSSSAAAKFSVGFLQAFTGKVVKAEQITLRSWARPLSIPQPPDWFTVPTSTINPAPVKPAPPNPPVDCFLQTGRLTAAWGGRHQDVYFYETILVKTSATKRQNGDNHNVVYRTYRNTQYLWELPQKQLRPTMSSPKLPCFSATRNWFVRQQWLGQSQRTCPFLLRRGGDDSLAHKHPDVPRLLDSFLHKLPPTASISERILHVVGTDDEHHVHAAVQAATNKAGRRLIKCDGLACFAHNNNNHDDYEEIRTSSSLPERVVSSGSLPDQLSGLQVAMQMAIWHAPSVLLLQDLDQEWNQHDRSSQEEQQKRFWATLIQGLSGDSLDKSINTLRGSDNESVPPYEQQWQQITLQEHVTAATRKEATPSVLVILSTRKPILPSSPLRGCLVFDSIQLSRPNQAYLQFLWSSLILTAAGTAVKNSVVAGSNRICSRQIGSDAEQEDNPSSVGALLPLSPTKEPTPLLRLLDVLHSHSMSESVVSLNENLLGRPASEIVEIQKKLIQTLLCQKCEPKEASDCSVSVFIAAATKKLRELCKERDEDRRRNDGGGGGSAASSQIPAVHWGDVGGLEHVRREILDAIELPLLRFPHLFSNNTRSGLLLYGPPGTGKTMVAKAVATECSLPFISVKGPELLGSYVGESEAAVRAVFVQARELAAQNQPACSILFFDELDSLAPRRGDDTNNSGGASVMDRVVATLFAELDRGDNNDSSSSKKGQVFCMGATNRPDLLDPALLRPGRFDRWVYLGVGGKEDRTNILSAQIGKLRLEGDRSRSNIEQIASYVVANIPSNLTGADLSTIASGALLIATQRLCQDVDAEVQLRLHNQRQRQTSSNDSATHIRDEILARWDERQLEPVVTVQDLLDAASKIVPSVSPDELEKYERLHQQFRTLS